MIFTVCTTIIIIILIIIMIITTATTIIIIISNNTISSKATSLRNAAVLMRSEPALSVYLCCGPSESVNDDQVHPATFSAHVLLSVYLPFVFLGWRGNIVQDNNEKNVSFYNVSIQCQLSLDDEYDIVYWPVSCLIVARNALFPVCMGDAQGCSPVSHFHCLDSSL